MTVGQLTKLLEQYDPDTRVVGMWEGVYENVQSVRLDPLPGADGKPLVVMNVDSWPERTPS